MSGIPHLARGTFALVLAPMEGVTDAPIRALMTERGGFAFCVSEFLRISHTVPPPHVYFRHMPELANNACTPSGVPVQLQLLGGDPGRLAEAAALGCELGARGIDLNFGCPAATVNRHDGGATLLKYPARLGAIVAAVRAAVPKALPVSAKLRLGWDTLDAIHANADAAEAGGASWITIHGRTKVAGYSPPAYWYPIGEVRARLSIPVVANGDIWTAEDFLRCREETGAEHFMLGRGAMADPALPLRISRGPAAGEQLGAPARSGDANEWLEVLSRFAEITGPRPDFSGHLTRRIKQWVRMAGLREPIGWFEPLKRAQNVEEVFAVVRAAAAATAPPPCTL